jgi:hypothetical protein
LVAGPMRCHLVTDNHYRIFATLAALALRPFCSLACLAGLALKLFFSFADWRPWR